MTTTGTSLIVCWGAQQRVGVASDVEASARPFFVLCCLAVLRRTTGTCCGAAPPTVATVLLRAARSPASLICPSPSVHTSRRPLSPCYYSQPVHIPTQYTTRRLRAHSSLSRRPTPVRHLSNQMQPCPYSPAQYNKSHRPRPPSRLSVVSGLPCGAGSTLCLCLTSSLRT